MIAIHQLVKQFLQTRGVMQPRFSAIPMLLLKYLGESVILVSFLDTFDYENSKFSFCEVCRIT